MGTNVLLTILYLLIDHKMLAEGMYSYAVKNALFIYFCIVVTRLC